MTSAYVHSFGAALGEVKRHVAESAEAGVLLSAATDLESAGFRWHHVCGPTTSAYDLALEACRRVPTAGVDAIVYATCLPANGNVGSAAAFHETRDVKHLMDFPASRLQAGLGLPDAVVFGLNQQACTSMLGSLRLAAALLAAEPSWRRVLCVTADRFPGGARYEQAYNLISDGGAACLVDREPAGFRLVAAHQITNGGLAAAGDDETVGTYFAYTHRLVRETLDRAGLTAAELDWIVPQNTNEKAWLILARLLGIDHARVWAPTIAEAGHVISADNVLNLLALQESGRLRPGHRIALVMAGFGLTWQCVILEVV